MKRTWYVSSLACIFALPLAIGRTPALEGTWEGDLHGVKAIALTIRETGGRAEGVAMFYVVRDENSGRHNGSPSPQIPLQNVRREGATLYFSVRGSNGEALPMEMKWTGPNTASLTRKRTASLPELIIPVRRTSASQ